MQVRKQPIGQGLMWMRQAVNLGLRNPRAVFGAALWMMATLYLVLVLLMAPAADAFRAGGEANLQAGLRWAVPAFLVLMLLLPVLMGGLMHVIREAEAGRPIGALGLFAPFRQPAALKLALLGVVQLLFGLVGGVLVVALAGTDYWTDYLAAMRSALGGTVPTMPEPAHPGLITLVQMAFNYFSYAMMLFAMPLILFSGASLPDSLKSALHAATRNFLPNFLAGAVFFGAVVLLTLVVALLATLATAVGSLLHPALGALFAFVLFVAVGAVLLVVITGAAYFAWRDTFGGDDTGGNDASGATGTVATQPVSVIEV